MESRSSRRLAKGKILLTIVLTSACWISLDLVLFYNSGLSRLFSAYGSNTKLPRDFRKTGGYVQNQHETNIKEFINSNDNKGVPMIKKDVPVEVLSSDVTEKLENKIYYDSVGGVNYKEKKEQNISFTKGHLTGHLEDNLKQDVQQKIDDSFGQEMVGLFKF